jgi:LAO/AO transport system kinase
MIALGSEAMVASGKRKGHVVHGGQKVDVIEGRAAKAEVWTPPIVKCVATRNEGIADLVAGLERHRVWLESTEAGRTRRHQRLAEEVRESLREALIEEATTSLAKELDAAVSAVESRTTDPYTAIEKLLTDFRAR